MKKVVLLAAFTTAIAFAHAQDYCKKIKAEISDDKTMFDYSSPYDPQQIPPVRVIRKYGTDPDAAFDNFSIIFQTAGKLDDVYTKTADGSEVEKDERGLVVMFDDKTRLTEDTVVITHDVTDDHMQSLRIAYYPISYDNAKQLSSKKIEKFILAGAEQTVAPDSAVAIMHYVDCMKTIRKE